MRVLMTADAVGGVWTYALDLARALAAEGADVVLATMGPPPTDEQRARALDVPRLALEVSTFKLEWMRDPWEDVRRAGDWLLDLERRHAPDVVHLNGYAHAALPWEAPALVVAHSCVAGWWDAVHGEPLPPEWSPYVKAVSRGLRAARLVVAPTRAMLDTLPRHHGDFDTPTRVIPNGRDPAGFAPGEKEPLVLAAGRAWDAAKDLATLDAAAKGAPWPVHVLGPTRDPDSGAEAGFRHARAEGRVDEPALRAWYGRASVYAHPARYEPFGLAPVEAALSGCALLLSDLPTLREVWGDAALYARAGDADAFRDGLRRLAGDDALRARLAERARARAHALTPAAMAAAYLDAYAALAEGRDASRSSTKEASPCAS